MMAKISAKFGPIHGNDGNTAYRTINGTTFQNYIDTEAPKKERTQRQKVYAALLKMMNRYTYNHYADLTAFFPKGNKRSSRHAFLAQNRGDLTPALLPLAERYANGEKVSDQQIENAVCSYAATNPRNIVIGLKRGYQPIYLTGEWPTKFSFLLYDLSVTPAEFQTVDGSFVQEEGDADAGGGFTPGGNPQPQQVTISVAASPTNGGNVSGGGTVAKGTQLTLTATPNSGYTFSRWSDGNTSATRTVTADSTMTYTAQFASSAPSGGGNGDD